MRAFGLTEGCELCAWLGLRGGRCEQLLDFSAEEPEPAADLVVVRGDVVEVLGLVLAARENDGWARLPIVAVLTNGTDEQQAACVRAGVAHCFSEPLELDEVRAVIERVERRPDAGPASTARAAAAIRIEEIVLSVRSLDEAEAAARFLAGFCPQPARQALGLSELLINAVEHGSLELGGAHKAELLGAGTYHDEVERRRRQEPYARREVTVWLRRFDDHVEIACEDQGPGFDWRRVNEHPAEALPNGNVLDERAGPSGRGIALARALAFDSVEYVGRGNAVVAKVSRERRREPRARQVELSSWERHALERKADRMLTETLATDSFDAAVELALEVTEAESGCFGGLDSEGRVETLSTRGRAGPELARASLPVAHEGSVLIDELVTSHQTIVDNAPHYFRAGDRQVRRSLLAPIVYGGQAIGFLHTADKPSDFTARDARRLEIVCARLAPVLAARVSAALAAKRTSELEREWSRTREEQEVARQLVGRLLRDGCLNAPGIRHLVAAKGVFSGDLALAARLPDGGLRLMLGDFVGHGLPAAIGGLPLGSVFYATTRKNVALADVITTMNETLLATLPRGFFCAAILLELGAGRLTYWNGGMPTALLRRAASGVVEELTSRDLALGMVRSRELSLEFGSFDIGPEDRVYCFSDGLIETRSPGGELYGLRRAMATIRDAEPDAAFDGLLRAVASFRGSTTHFDDLSLVELAGSAAAPEDTG